jgi:hypothetical protein
MVLLLSMECRGDAASVELFQVPCQRALQRCCGGRACRCDVRQAICNRQSAGAVQAARRDNGRPAVCTARTRGHDFTAPWHAACDCPLVADAASRVAVNLTPYRNGVTLMKTTLTVSALAFAMALSLSACKPESPAEVQEDMAEERADAIEEVADEREELADAAEDANDEIRDEAREGDGEGMAEAQADAIEETAAERYDVRVAEADGVRKVEKERCDGLPDGERGACNDAAEAAYDMAKAAAQAELDAAQADADVIDDSH